MGLLIRFKKLLMHILLFTVCAVSLFIAFSAHKLPLSDQFVIIPDDGGTLSVLYGIALVIVISVVMMLNSVQGIILRQNIVLPSLIYLASVVRILPSYGVNDSLVAALSIAFMLYAAEVAVVRQNNNGPIFWVGLMAVTASLFAPKLVILVPLSVILLAIMGRFTIKDLSALFVGWCSALLFIFTAAYCSGTVQTIVLRWYEALFFYPLRGFESVGEWGRVAATLLVVIVMVVVTLTKLSSQIYTSRRVVGIYLITLVALIASVLFFGGVGYDILYISSIPSAVVLAFTFANSSSVVMKVLLLIYLLSNLWPVGL